MLSFVASRVIAIAFQKIIVSQINFAINQLINIFRLAKFYYY